MAILNLTPDSFYDGGHYNTPDKVLRQAEKLLEDGADILDVGGYSTRPGADDIPLDEELSRTVPVIEALSEYFPEAIISVDTFRARVAQEAVLAGARLINDISGGHIDPEIWQVAARYRVPYILMHMRGTPQTMTQLNDYSHLLKEIFQYFAKKIPQLRALGVEDIILDPGIGFAKNPSQNFEIMAHLHLFKHLGLPCLIGLSRKSLIWKTLKVSPSEALNGTSVLNTLALLKSAHFLRVHDVKEAREARELLAQLRQYQ